MYQLVSLALGLESSMKALLLTILTLVAGYFGITMSGVDNVEDNLIQEEVRLGAGEKPNKQKIAEVVNPIAKTARNNYYIEVIEINEIEKGVEVFARVWDKTNKQIGFGSGGTVDIEKFIIINPPVNVPDPDGDIIKQVEIEGGQIVDKKYREDPEEALLQILETTIDVKTEKHDDSKIKPNKKGKTTLTLYPATGANAPTDGYLQNVGDASWAAQREDASGSASDVVGASVTMTCDTNGVRETSRAVFGFDTSVIGGSEIISATFSTTNSRAEEVGDDDQYAYINVYQALVNTSSTLATADYSYLRFNFGTPFSTGIDWEALNPTDGDYNDWVLNASGLAWIKPSEYTFLGVAWGHDAENQECTGTKNETGFNTADNGTLEPKLVVEVLTPVLPIQRQNVNWFD